MHRWLCFQTAVLALAMVVAGCSESMDSVTGSPSLAGSPTAALLSSDGSGGVTDAAGDGASDPNVDPDPDLVSGSVTCDGEFFTFDARLAPGTFDAASTVINFAIDIDQNPSSGFGGVDAAGNDAGLLGTDYSLVINDGAGTATLTRYAGLFGGWMAEGTYPLTGVGDGFSVAVPMAAFLADPVLGSGSEDGNLTFKVTAQGRLSASSTTPILDYMPDLGIDPGLLAGCDASGGGTGGGDGGTGGGGDGTGGGDEGSGGDDPPSDFIDLTPVLRQGGDDAHFNCQNPNKLVVVVLPGSADFDVADVDVASVRFAEASEWHVHKRTGEFIRHEADGGDDGYPDLVFHFRMGDTNLDCASSEAEFHGRLHSGREFRGMVSIGMVEPAGGATKGAGSSQAFQ